MNKKQRDLILYKTTHKLLLAKINGGELQALPIYKSTSYTVWCYSHIFDVEVFGTINGKNEDIQKLCKPLSYVNIDKLNKLVEDAYNTLSLSMVSNPNIPALLPEELLYDDEGNDNFVKLFPEDITVMLKTRFGTTGNINEEMFKIVKMINSGEHIAHNRNDFSYFQTFIVMLSLLGGIKGVVVPYNKFNSYGKSVDTYKMLWVMLNKRNIYSPSKYIERSPYLSSLKANNVSYREPNALMVDTNTHVDTDFKLEKSIRELYEIQIAPYLYNLKKKEFNA